MLVLIGNYDAAEAAETILPPDGEILDTATGKKSPSAGSFHLKVPAGESILLMVEEK